MFRRLNIETHAKQLKALVYPRKKINVSRHASERAAQKHIVIPAFIQINAGEIVEAEFTDATISKIVVRRSATATHDLVLVLIPNPKNVWFAVTCWLNEKTDKHKTLNIKRIST
jgi:hypothetical protein